MTKIQEVPKDNLMRIAWEKYKLTDEYLNSFEWAEYKEHRGGSLWSAYAHSFKDADMIAELKQKNE